MTDREIRHELLQPREPQFITSALQLPSIWNNVSAPFFPQSLMWEEFRTRYKGPPDP
jgi:hypothetical protein